MSIRNLVMAATVGLSAVTISSCVETTGPYYGGYAGYGGYYGTTVYSGFYDPYRYGGYYDPYRYDRYRYDRYRNDRYRNDGYRYDRNRDYNRHQASQGGNNPPSFNPQPNPPPGPPSGNRRVQRVIPPDGMMGGSGRSHQ